MMLEMCFLRYGLTTVEKKIHRFVDDYIIGVCIGIL